MVDYGVGNLGSILNMLRYLQIVPELVDRPEELPSAERILLPGVGSFDRGVSGLTERGLGSAIVTQAALGTPVLGVCLGMQLLTEGSEEGSLSGLGLIPGSCRKLRPVERSEKVPHMGWNWVRPAREHPLVDNLPDQSKFFFAHSYHALCRDQDDILATSEYCGTFTSMVARGNVAGAQFHPEKSHAFGMALLEGFARWSP